VGRLAVFKANASRVIKTFAGLFDTNIEKLKGAYAELMKKQYIIDKWIQQDRQGIAPQSGDVMKEKAEIIGALFRAKASLAIFERIYFRLLELEYYFSQGYGSGDIRPGLPIKKFFTELKAKRFEIEQIIGKMKYVMKLFALRNGGYFPVDALGSLSDDKEFFDDKDEFFKR